MSTPHDQSNPLNPDASPTNDDAASVEAIPSLEESLRQAELLAQEHHDAWLRARAESDNIRKRAQQDIANAHKYAIENFATELLAVKDSLEAALNDSNSDRSTLQEGVALTLKQLSIAFEKAKLLEINPVGDKFDPHKHQAISMLASEAEPNTVITVLQKGYSLQERVIRPALVTVAKAG